jgi:hypothetical protein
MTTSSAALQKRRSPTALPTILVVDTGVHFGLSLNRSLREYGYDVRLATSADHAVRSVHARHFEFMVVVDDGEGRARGAVIAVRGVVPSLPCVVIGCEGALEGEHEIMAHAGPVRVIGRQFDLMKLITEIETALKVAPPMQLVCQLAETEQPTRRDLPAMPSEDRTPRSVTPARRVPAVMEDPPEVAHSRRPTVKLRSRDAGVYSMRNNGRDVVEILREH